MAKKSGLPRIVINSNVKDRMSFTQLEGMQGELKTVSKESLDKLKKSILKHGFFVPMFIWENPEDATLRILDGHTRLKALKEFKDEGYSIPQIPFIFIDAKDHKDAKLKLAAITSQYGKFTPEGVKGFFEDFEIPELDFIDMPHIDFAPVLELDEGEAQTTTVSEHQRELKNTSKEVDLNDFKDFDHTCPKCGFEWNK